MTRVASLGIFAVVVACSGGGGTSTGPSAIVREPVDAGRDDPGSGRDTPPSTRDTPPSSTEPGGSSPSAATSCLPCDGKYSCSGTSQGQTLSHEEVDLNASTTPGVCEFGGSFFACGGGIYADGKPGTLIATWTPTSDGGFGIQGQGTAITCVPLTKTGGKGG